MIYYIWFWCDDVSYMKTDDWKHLKSSCHTVYSCCLTYPHLISHEKRNKKQPKEWPPTSMHCLKTVRSCSAASAISFTEAWGDTPSGHTAAAAMASSLTNNWSSFFLATMAFETSSRIRSPVGKLHITLWSFSCLSSWNFWEFFSSKSMETSRDSGSKRGCKRQNSLRTGESAGKELCLPQATSTNSVTSGILFSSRKKDTHNLGHVFLFVAASCCYIKLHQRLSFILFIAPKSIVHGPWSMVIVHRFMHS